MTSAFSTIDYIVFIAYAVMIVAIGLWISRTKGKERTAQDFFLADRALSWWAIGASLIAANISAEHFIAMSGSGYAIGLGIAVYEWIGAISLIFVAKFFLPVFIDKKIYTMPQFLKGRFNQGVSTAFAVFWLLVYVFVNLTSITYLGALALENILGIPLFYGIIGLAAVAGIYSIYGGLKAVAWTDVIQVIFLIGGGLVTTFLALDAVAPDGGILAGFAEIYKEAPDHFNMIIEKNELIIPSADGTKDAYLDLPGLAVIIGAMWLTNFGYWGFNQYIIQKGLAAKNLREAKRGLLFGGFLKILIPLLVIIPGITAYVLSQKYSIPEIADMIGVAPPEVGEITKSDEAYPWLLRNFVPEGVRGVAFAALAAAIVSSLASMINSTSTIFTMDIYKAYIKPDAENRDMVKIGRIVSFGALLIAVLIAPKLDSLDSAFQYIQEYTGYIYPGVVAVFAMGMFWKQITANAALWTAIVTIPLGILIKILFPEMPFILRMGYVFIGLCFIATALTFIEKRHRVKNDPVIGVKAQSLVRTGYILIALGVICLILGAALIQSLINLGFESIFMLATLFIMLGFILIWNVKLDFKDHKAINVNYDDFKTGPVFNLGAIAIVAIITVLYVLFW